MYKKRKFNQQRSLRSTGENIEKFSVINWFSREGGLMRRDELSSSYTPLKFCINGKSKRKDSTLIIDEEETRRSPFIFSNCVQVIVDVYRENGVIEFF